MNDKELREAVEKMKSLADLRHDALVNEEISKLPKHEGVILRLNMKLTELQIDALKKRDNERTWDFIKLLIGYIVGAACTGLVSWLLLKAEKPIQVFPIIHQKTQVVHDTIYIASPNILKDTSLVRLVKIKPD